MERIKTYIESYWMLICPRSCLGARWREFNWILKQFSHFKSWSSYWVAGGKVEGWLWERFRDHKCWRLGKLQMKLFRHITWEKFWRLIALWSFYSIPRSLKSHCHPKSVTFVRHIFMQCHRKTSPIISRCLPFLNIFLITSPILPPCSSLVDIFI